MCAPSRACRYEEELRGSASKWVADRKNDAGSKARKKRGYLGNTRQQAVAISGSRLQRGDSSEEECTDLNWVTLPSGRGDPDPLQRGDHAARAGGLKPPG